jgi:hypothetical protein
MPANDYRVGGGAEVSELSILAEIRRRFVGSGEEHEALKAVVEKYSEAYEQGKQAGLAEGEASRHWDQRLLAMSEAYMLGCPIDSRLIEAQQEPDSKDWVAETVAARMLAIGVTDELLAAIVAKFTALKTK